ncbi:FAD-dependent oxidoreductase, partial [Salmonella enterica subsp. enterica serovar Infantis]
DDIELYTGKDFNNQICSYVYCCELNHKWGGHVHTLNILLGSAHAATSLAEQNLEDTPLVHVRNAKTVRERTALGTEKAAKL